MIVPSPVLETRALARAVAALKKTATVPLDTDPAFYGAKKELRRRFRHAALGFEIADGFVTGISRSGNSFTVPL